MVNHWERDRKRKKEWEREWAAHYLYSHLNAKYKQLFKRTATDVEPKIPIKVNSSRRKALYADKAPTRCSLYICLCLAPAIISIYQRTIKKRGTLPSQPTKFIHFYAKSGSGHKDSNNFIALLVCSARLPVVCFIQWHSLWLLHRIRIRIRIQPEEPVEDLAAISKRPLNSCRPSLLCIFN